MERDPVSNEISFNMPEVRKFKKLFSSEVLCASFWGSNQLLGTKSGLVFMDRSGDGRAYKLIPQRVFHQIETVDSLGVLVAISGKKGKLRAYSLNFLKWLILPETIAKSVSLVPFTSVGGVQDCTHFRFVHISPTLHAREYLSINAQS